MVLPTDPFKYQISKKWKFYQNWRFTYSYSKVPVDKAGRVFFFQKSANFGNILWIIEKLDKDFFVGGGSKLSKISLILSRVPPLHSN